jgi:hypothetical protein
MLVRVATTLTFLFAVAAPLGGASAQSLFNPDDLNARAEQSVARGMLVNEFSANTGVGLLLGVTGANLTATYSHTFWFACDEERSGSCMGLSLAAFGGVQVGTNSLLASLDGSSGNVSYSDTGVTLQRDVFAWRAGGEVAFWLGAFGLAGRYQHYDLSTTWTDKSTGSSQTGGIALDQAGPGLIFRFSQRADSTSDLSVFWLPPLSGSSTAALFAARLRIGINMLAFGLEVENGPNPSSAVALTSETAWTFLATVGVRVPW